MLLPSLVKLVGISNNALLGVKSLRNNLNGNLKERLVLKSIVSGDTGNNCLWF